MKAVKAFLSHSGVAKTHDTISERIHNYYYLVARPSEVHTVRVFLRKNTRNYSYLYDSFLCSICCQLYNAWLLIKNGVRSVVHLVN